MPDQNNPTDTSISPTQVNPPSEPTQMPTTPPAPMDIPVSDASIPPPFPPESSPIEGSTPPSDFGSAAPSFDIPPVITPSQPKKKFGGKRVIATILGLLVLVGGLGAGVLLVRQQQDIREKAAIAPYPDCSSGYTYGARSVDAATQACIGRCDPNKNYARDDCKPYGEVKAEVGGAFCYKCLGGEPTPNICALSRRDPNSQGYCDRSAPNTPDCTDKDEGDDCTIRSQCGGGTGTCVVINQGGANAECQCQKGAAPPPYPTKTPTPTEPPGGGPSAQCLNVKAYDTSWNLLTSDQLKALMAGDKVRFTVGGTTTGGSFDKAKFKINGVQRPEVTGKRPATEEYFDEYTIPEAITTFTINAQIHHATLGWSE